MESVILLSIATDRKSRLNHRYDNHIWLEADPGRNKLKANPAVNGFLKEAWSRESAEN